MSSHGLGSPVPLSASSTSTNLIQRAQSNDPLAWERLSHLYGPLVYDWARRAGLQAHDAADVMQEVFQTVARKLVAFQWRRESDSFRAWLRTITRHKIVDHFRQMGDQIAVEGGTDAHRSLQAVPDSRETCDEDSHQELQGVRRRAMELVSAEFESRTWQAFWRTTIENEPPAEVAHDLDISVWAIYKARARVLQRLREEFALLLE